MISYWIYDPHTNEAKQQNVDLGVMEDHFHNSTERNFFRVQEYPTYISVISPDEEYLEMKDVTPEQIVILFAIVRGLKEAARE